MSAEIDWDTYEPTRAVRAASMTLFTADAVEAACFGWVPQAREALSVALDVEEMAAVMADHPDVWASASGWKCAGCSRLVPGRVRSELREAAKQKHQAAALRAAILGTTS
jgi:hypothetical protein